MANTLTKAENFDGRILGYTRISNNSTASGYANIEPTASMTVMQTAQGTDVSVTFTAPPCKGIGKSFLNGNCKLVDEKVNPTYGRWCAKVLKEGQISIGDVIEIDT